IRPLSTLCSFFSSVSDLSLLFFFFQLSGAHRYLHSFPTRRSSDLPSRSRHSSHVFLASYEVKSGRVPSRRWVSRCRSDAREGVRSEEHTSELQSLTNLVCRLLLEKKKKLSTTTSAWPRSH